MRNFAFPRLAAFGWLLATLALCLVAPQPRAADLDTIELNRALGEGVTRYVTTDGSIAMRIQYVGTLSVDSDISIAVAAGGDITLEDDAGDDDTTVSSDGVIDVSDGAEDTYGEVADAINASANWECILVDVLPSHSINNVLTEVSETSTGLVIEEGLALYYNTADMDMLSASIGPEYQVDDVLSVTNDRILNRRSDPIGVGQSLSWRNEVYLTSATATYSSGAPDLEIYAVSSDSAGAVELLLWSQVGAASGSSSSIDMTDLPAIQAPPGWRIVCVYDDDSTPDITAGSIQVHGLSWNQ